MADNGTLSAEQSKFVAALCDGGSIRDCAKVAGISERTAWRWLGLEVVQRELSTRQDALLSQATSALVGDMTTARAVLVGMMNDTSKPPGVRVRAAGLILDCGLRFLEVLTLARRVEELERRLDAQPK